MPAVLAFDIETVPDVAGLRLLHGFPADVPDADAVEMAKRLQRQKKNHDFLPPYLQRVVAISCVLRDAEDTAAPFKIFTLPPKPDGGEAEAINLFFRGLQKYRPVLVSWNGGGFDLPVLHYRAMKHNITAPAYWRADDSRQTYTNRYHERHLDLMDLLSLYQPQARAPLDEFAKLCGLPGKIGIGGGGVWDAHQRGDDAAIRRYCEADAMLTYLLYVRFQHFRSRLDGNAEAAAVRAFLRKEADKADGEIWREFLNGWAE